MSFDPDFGKTGFPRRLFRLRFRQLELTQQAFATRYGLSFGMVRSERAACASASASATEVCLRSWVALLFGRLGAVASPYGRLCRVQVDKILCDERSLLIAEIAGRR